jgi:hypothetical protein
MSELGIYVKMVVINDRLSAIIQRVQLRKEVISQPAYTVTTIIIVRTALRAKPKYEYKHSSLH